MATVPADLPLSTPVDKRRMCEMLGWSRPTFDKRLREDPFFPVLKAGEGKRDPWQFDPRAVLDYVRTGKLTRARQPGDDVAVAEPDAVVTAPPAATRSAPPPPAPAPEPPVDVAPARADRSGRVVNLAEVTAKARVQDVTAQLAEDKLRLNRGQLVEMETLAIVLGEAFVDLGAWFAGLPDTLVKLDIIPEENVARAAKLFNAQREQWVKKIEQQLSAE